MQLDMLSSTQDIKPHRGESFPDHLASGALLIQHANLCQKLVRRYTPVNFVDLLGVICGQEVLAIVQNEIVQRHNECNPDNIQCCLHPPR
jgi:hypothetical protein